MICMVRAHVTGWEPYDLYDLANIPRVRSVLSGYRSCTLIAAGTGCI